MMTGVTGGKRREERGLVEEVDRAVVCPGRAVILCSLKNGPGV